MKIVKSDSTSVSPVPQNSFTYQEAFDASLSYFSGDELAAKVFLDKYALRDNEQNILERTPDDMHWRIANEFARIEKDKFKNPLTSSEIHDLLKNFSRIVPQGSPMSGIGNPYQMVSLSNCFVIDPPADSYSGIHRTDEQLSQISKRRGGVGLDISNLRPAGTVTHNAARTSTGIIPFMERFSNSIREVGQGGRRGALMITICVHHPEVIDFATVKTDLSKVTGANISIRLSNEFLKAVENNEDYEQRWPVDAREKGTEPVISKMVNAKSVWMKIIESAHKMAEPGLLFWDNIISESPADCYADVGYKTVSTNPCSELPLSILDSCRLLLLNLYSYVVRPFEKDAYFDMKRFRNDAILAQRLMDDMIDLEVEKINAIINKIKLDPESEDLKRVELETWQKILQACLNGRRTGTGITALGDAMAACGVRYGTDESIVFTESIYRELKLACYRSSVDMAKEIGPFPVWNHEKEKNCPFLLRIREEDPSLWEDMKKYGRRNIALLTTAPAGSLSIETQTTSGIESLFMIGYKRRKKINPNDSNSRVDFVDPSGDKWQEFVVYHPKVSEWMRITGETDVEKSPYFGCCAEDLDWKQRVVLQSAANRHVDHAISSTINLPENVSVENVATIYETAWKAGCKGMTVYRKNCRTGVLVENKKPEVINHIPKTTAPKRPKEVRAHVHHVSVRGESYFVMVGFLNENEPYEVFAGKNGFFPKDVKMATIKKLTRGKYEARFDDGTIIPDLVAHIENEEEAITRLVSTGLRHGVDIGFITHQLEKINGDMFSFAKAVSRALKKHIKDGTKVHGESCPSCGGENIQRREGCSICVDCGASKCS